MTNYKLLHAPAVRAYVLSAIDMPEWDSRTGNPNEKDKLLFFFAHFYNEYYFNINRMGIATAAKEYLKGLPSTINIAFTYYDIEKLMRDWGYLNESSTESEIGREVDNYWTKIANALCVLGHRHQVIN